MSQANNHALISGVPWFDDRGETVNAHGSCLVEQDGRFYLFGEYKTDDANEFIGFSCYSSPDLIQWRFERMALTVQPGGLLGPGRVGERVKVMRSPHTGQYVMFLHADNDGYADPHICIAVSDSINGDYRFIGALTYQGEPIRRWDMGTFQDTDGTGYLLLHEGDIYRLRDDYLEAETLVVANIARGGESPAMVKTGGHYFAMFSNKTSWDTNDNYQLSAPAIEGPWTFQGLFAPDGSHTCDSQSTFAIGLRTSSSTVPMYLGDRWSFPHQGSAATYVWQPMQRSEDHLVIPHFVPAWDPRTGAEVILEGEVQPVGLASNQPNYTIDIAFSGRQVLLRGPAMPDGAYARIAVFDKTGNVILRPIFVSFYSKVPHSGIRYASSLLKRGEYVVRIQVEGVPPVWSDKRGERFGSVGAYVRIDDALIID